MKFLKRTKKAEKISKTLGLSTDYVFLEALFCDNDVTIAGTSFKKNTVYPVFVNFKNKESKRKPLNEISNVNIMLDSSLLSFFYKGYNQLKRESKNLIPMNLDDYLLLLEQDRNKLNKAEEGEF